MRKNKTYWAKIPFFDNFFLLILKYNRENIHNIFLKSTNYNNSQSLLDIGTTSDNGNSHNIILRKTSNNKNISCLSNQNLKNLKDYFPHIKKFYKRDAKKINFKKNSFDIIYSSATIEHLGSFNNQLKFVKECVRIARKKIFITTPNRFYPIDFHTKLPFLHWLPKNIHRKILNLIGFKFFSLEKNLNLLSKKNFIDIMKINKIKKYRILEHKFLFFTSNLIIIIDKRKN
jgi:ubiquinone/menaquinone biosynthesis C-methylase UbiE